MVRCFDTVVVVEEQTRVQQAWVLPTKPRRPVWTEMRAFPSRLEMVLSADGFLPYEIVFRRGTKQPSTPSIRSAREDRRRTTATNPYLPYRGGHCRITTVSHGVADRSRDTPLHHGTARDPTRACYIRSHITSLCWGKGRSRAYAVLSRAHKCMSRAACEIYDKVQ